MGLDSETENALGLAPMKNPHAVALGRLGGAVGGKARTKAKRRAAQLNGCKGGRPAKKKVLTRKPKAA